MPPSQNLSKQLASLGIHLPAWPEEAEKDDTPSSWIDRGHAYAAGVRLWRMQLRNAPESSKHVVEHLVEHLRDNKQLGAWEQLVTVLIKPELHGSPDSDRRDECFELLLSPAPTPAQLLGIALEMAQEQKLPLAAYGIKRLLKENTNMRGQERLRICAAFVSTGNTSRLIQQSHTSSTSWVQATALNEQMTGLLGEAVNALKVARSSDASITAHTAMINRLDTISDLMAGKKTDEPSRIESLAESHKWTEALTEINDLFSKPYDRKVLHAQVRTSVLSAFCGSPSARVPKDYMEVNEIRCHQNHAVIEAWQDGFKASARLQYATPLVLIDSFEASRKRLERQPFWICYGNSRSGSTMIFNLLRILANSLSSSALSAWEEDFATPEKFFEIVNESPGVNLGVLKIHRNHDSVNSRLLSGEAMAIISHRNMGAACHSYWRMLNNPESPFFNSQPDKNLLHKFMESQIREFGLKSRQPNTLIVKETDLRMETLCAIDTITKFAGIKPTKESLLFLSEFLSVDKLRQLSKELKSAFGSAGHQSVTYLHQGHISEGPCKIGHPQEIEAYISWLMQEYQGSLDKDGYCRVE